jgi:uncharacterized protein (TIGR00369 family)
MNPVFSDSCFACGPHNSIGLKLRIEGDSKRVSARFLPRKEHEGWAGIVHGGIIATLLDEVLAWICKKNGLGALTARLSIRFRNPANIGEEISAHAEITEIKGRAIKGTARVQSCDGKIVAEAEALLLRAAPIR